MRQHIMHIRQTLHWIMLLQVAGPSLMLLTSWPWGWEGKVGGCDLGTGVGMVRRGGVELSVLHERHSPLAIALASYTLAAAACVPVGFVCLR